jgi:aminopeptidase N
MSPRRVLTLGVLLALGVPAAAACDGTSEKPAARLTSSDADTTGVTSGGDPYFPLDGNRGYEVQHYRITDSYLPATDWLRGTTVLRATATEDLTRFSLDLVLRVDQVWVDGRPAHFRKPVAHELLVRPGEAVEAGESFTVRVRYHGLPGSVRAAGVSPGSDLWFHRPGETVALGEPQNGAWWFAANETPQDKASFDITIRVPRGTEAVSGGALVAHRVADGRAGWHWRIDQPVATYMVFFATGQFRLEQGLADGRPYVYAVSTRLDREDRRTALRRLRESGGIVAWLEGALGPYPFGEIGGVVPGTGLPYALEDATRPVYPWSSVSGDEWRVFLVHELAHQWFGDDVALQRWRDVWLNEGFATYAEWWYAEKHGGASVATMLTDTYESMPVDSPFWEVVVSDPGPAQMWSRSVYLRGAMTLAALRTRIGEADLAAILRAWAARNAGGHGSGQELRDLAEEISGEDLDAFFRHWLDEADKPAATAENGLG